MSSKLNSVLSQDFDLENESYTLGFRELLFLALIFFFAFCGFTVCVDKLYQEDSEKAQIDNVIIHSQTGLNEHSSSSRTRISGYAVD